MENSNNILKYFITLEPIGIASRQYKICFNWNELHSCIVKSNKVLKAERKLKTQSQIDNNKKTSLSNRVEKLFTGQSYKINLVLENDQIYDKFFGT